MVMRSLLATALAVMLAAQAAAQSAYSPSRLSDGRPDLQGSWTNDTQTPLQRSAEFGGRLTLSEREAQDLETAAARRQPPFGGFFGLNGSVSFNLGGSTDPEAYVKVMRVGGQPRTSLITTTPDGRFPPRKASAAAQRAPPVSPYGDDPESFTLAQRCLTSPTRMTGPLMMPALENNNYQFVQTRDALAIYIEVMHDVRIVRIGGKHRTDGVRPWMGDSIGRWDGDTLVVETTHVPPVQSIQGSWRDLKITERFTRVSQDRVLYRFTLEDPTVWDKPWGGEYEFSPARRPLREYACHEGNYTMANIMGGHRYEEMSAAEKQAALGR